MKKLIDRPFYTSKILKRKDKQEVKLLVGVRRCGKSSIIKLLIQKLLELGVEETQIIYISLELRTYAHFRDSSVLEKWIENRINKEGKTYLFIDEVQELENWAEVINSFNETYDIDIYLTGSNSNMFSGQHLTYLGGRYVSYEIFPLSLKEIKLFENTHNELSTYYNIFLQGSFPTVVFENDEEEKTKILNDLFESVYLRDIVLNGKIRNLKQLENVSRFLFDSVGKSISINRIKERLKQEEKTVTFATVAAFLKLFEAAYLLFHCRRFDVQGNTLLHTNGKYYSIDIALAQYAASNNQTNDGFKLENFVYLELRKAGYKVHTVMVNRDYEIDFYAEKGQSKMYIQVALSVTDEKTLEREVRPFKFLKHDAQKFLLTTDTFPITTYECTHMNVFEFIEFKL